METETVKKLFDILLSLGGLGMGMVLSILNAVLFLFAILLPLDLTTLALAWIMAAFIFAAGFFTAKKHYSDLESRLGSEA